MDIKKKNNIENLSKKFQYFAAGTASQAFINKCST